jgi:aspartyl-tRNA(Asn)/glutamyl-tRNA(Gln) amidotransferase subunit A
LLELGAAAIAAAVGDGKAKAADVLAAALARIASTHEGDLGLNAFRAIAPRDAAAEPGDAVERAPAGSLAGVPVAVKDNIATLTLPTGCSSRILEGWVSPYEATAIRKLREAGATVVGKTNMDEFAMGSSTENSAYGPSRNPVDRSRAPGGSSGGSAVAVAAGIAPIGLGSETGGSVRQPAAFCGVVGVKPTYGRVSRHGLVAFASSLDCVGTFGRTVDDAALATETVSGHDPLDATSAATPVPSMRVGAGRLDGLVVGVPAEYFPDTLPAAMRAHCERALEALRARGATLREVSLPHTALAIPVYYIIAPAEASSNLARFDGVRYGLRIAGDGARGLSDATRAGGFGAEVTRRILLGTYVLSAGYYDAYYRKAQDVRALIARDFTRVFSSGVDVLFTPTTPTPAFKLGAISDPYEMYLSDIFTVTANLAGLPAISLPIGRIEGLPVGGQFIANHFAEPVMFRAAYALEDALGTEAHR